MSDNIPIKEINRLAFPAIVAGISEPLISIADTAIIGHLGTEQQGAVGLGATLFTFLIWIFAQTKSAISAIISKSVGKGDLQPVKTLVPQSIILNCLLGLSLLALTYPLSHWLFQNAYKASGELLVDAMSYYHIRAWGFPLTLATFGIFGVFRGYQNTSWAMWISLTGASVNLILDLALVYGIETWVPAMGIQGAAIASLMAQGIILILAIVVMYRKTPFRLSPFGKLNPLIRDLLGMSLNLFIRTIALNIAYSLAARFATVYGQISIAAHTIAMNIWLFSAFFIDGYAGAGNALAGRILGSGNTTGLRQLAKDISKISLIIGGMLSVVYIVIYPFIGRWFNPDPAVIHAFDTIFWLVILSQPVNGIAFAFDGIFKGLGRMSDLRNTLLLSTFFGFIPCLYLTSYFKLSLTGIWMAFLLWMIGRGGTLVILFYRKVIPKKAVK